MSALFLDVNTVTTATSAGETKPRNIPRYSPVPSLSKIANSHQNQVQANVIK